MYGASGASNSAMLKNMQQPDGINRFVGGGLDGMVEDSEEVLPEVAID